LFVGQLGRLGRLIATNWKVGGYRRLFVGRLFATNWKVGGYHRLFVGRLIATNWKVGGYICVMQERNKKQVETHSLCV
jgi:hypothetical protein